LASSGSFFDVEQFRHEPRRLAVARDVAGPTLVLGSTQHRDLVDEGALRGRGVDLVRRRGGGGAVYLGPGEQLWLDVWLPRDDPLWMPDVSAAAEWVGAWWMEALAESGPHGLGIHRGRSVPGEFGDLVCFAGRGPGEVFHGDAKVVGLSQWRSRQGALFSTCAYLRWHPAALLDVVALEEDTRVEMARDLTPRALGLAELEPPVLHLDGLRAALLTSLPAFSVTGSSG
jgi:lipoate---protein ligase